MAEESDGLLSNIMSSFKDDKGLFQGGGEGRMFGRGRDAIFGTSDQNTRELSEFKGGKSSYDDDVDLGHQKRSLMRGILGGEDIYEGDGKRKMSWEDIGIEGDPRQDPKRWGELFDYGDAQYNDENWYDQGHTGKIKAALRAGYESGDIGRDRDFISDWNEYGAPAADPRATKSALGQHGSKTGSITSDILEYGSDNKDPRSSPFNVQDLVKRSSIVEDPNNMQQGGFDFSMGHHKKWGMGFKGRGEKAGLTQDDKYASPRSSRQEMGDYSQRAAETDLKDAGYIIDKRIEDAGY